MSLGMLFKTSFLQLILKTTPLGMFSPILKMRKLRLCELSDFPNYCNEHVEIWQRVIRSEKS